MDDAFEKLRQQGKNDVDNIINWMKEAKVLNDKITEEELNRLFEADRKAKLELAQFKEILAKVAEDQKKAIEDFNKLLFDISTKFLEALQAGAAAAQETLSKK